MADEILEMQIAFLIGKPVRVYQTGNVLTEDFIDDRVNIEVSESGNIIRIWLG